MTRVVFITGHRFGMEMLRGLTDANVDLDVVAVLGLHPRYAFDTVGYVDVVNRGARLGVPTVMFNSVKSAAVVSFLQHCPHDYLFAVGLSQLVPSEILGLPAAFNHATVRNASTHGCIGAHPTLLPQGRGRAPIPWTIIHGLTHSGVSAFYLDEEVDAGGLIGQERFDVSPNDTATTVFAKVEAAHYSLGRDLAVQCARRALSTVIPSDSHVNTLWPKRTARDGWLDLARSARDLIRLVKALQPPYPPPFLVYDESIFYVTDAYIKTEHGSPNPGLVLASGDHTISAWTSDAVLELRIAIRATASLPPPGTIIFTRKSRCIDA